MMSNFDEILPSPRGKYLKICKDNTADIGHEINLEIICSNNTV